MNEAGAPGNQGPDYTAAELVVGIAVLATVLLGALTVAWRGGAFERLTRQSRPAVTWFRSIGALQVKEPVLWRGYPVGEVSAISFDTVHRLIRVDMQLEASFPIPGVCHATITAASLAALTSYIELSPGMPPQGSAPLVRGRPEVVARNGALEIDAVDPINTGAFLAQGSMTLSQVSEAVDGVMGRAATELAGWDRDLSDPGFTARVHGEVARARDSAAAFAGRLDDVDRKIASAEREARTADRWLADRGDSFLASVARAQHGTSEARTWLRERAASPAVVDLP